MRNLCKFFLSLSLCGASYAQDTIPIFEIETTNGKCIVTYMDGADGENNTFVLQRSLMIYWMSGDLSTYHERKRLPDMVEPYTTLATKLTQDPSCDQSVQVSGPNDPGGLVFAYKARVGIGGAEAFDGSNVRAETHVSISSKGYFFTQSAGSNNHTACLDNANMHALSEMITYCQRVYADSVGQKFTGD